MAGTPFVALAVLRAAPGQRRRLRENLLGLVEPTRAEPAALDYSLFESADERGTFYMRESFSDEDGFERHRASAHYQRFAAEAAS